MCSCGHFDFRQWPTRFLLFIMPSRFATLAANWVVSRYKAPLGIIVRASVATLLSTADLASDVYTIATLFGLRRLVPAYALLGMICSSIAVQVRPRAWTRVILDNWGFLCSSCSASP
jgi:hypothetical protein